MTRNAYGKLDKVDCNFNQIPKIRAFGFIDVPTADVTCHMFVPTFLVVNTENPA